MSISGFSGPARHAEIAKVPPLDRNLRWPGRTDFAVAGSTPADGAGSLAVPVRADHHAAVERQ